MSSASAPVLPSARADQLSYYGRSTGWKVRRSLWILVPLLSAGIAAWAVFVWFALETKAAIFWWASVLSLGLVVAGFALSAEAPWLVPLAWLGSVVFSLAVNKRLQILWSWKSAERERELTGARADEARLFADLQAAQARFLAADRAIRERDEVVAQWRQAIQTEAQKHRESEANLRAAELRARDSQLLIAQLQRDLAAARTTTSVRAETQRRDTAEFVRLTNRAIEAEKTSSLAEFRHRREMEAAAAKATRLEAEVEQGLGAQARLRNELSAAEKTNAELEQGAAAASLEMSRLRTRAAAAESALDASRESKASKLTRLEDRRLAIQEALSVQERQHRHLLEAAVLSTQKASRLSVQEIKEEAGQARSRVIQLSDELARARAEAAANLTRAERAEVALARAEGALASAQAVRVEERLAPEVLPTETEEVAGLVRPQLAVAAELRVADPEVQILVDSVLASEVYRRQHARAGRAALAESAVSNLVTALLTHGGKMSQASLAAAVGADPERLRPTLKALRRLLNIDGYPVVELVADEGTVLLNAALLAEQFGVAAA